MNKFACVAVACAGMICGMARASDSYNPSNGQLSIPSVQLGSTVYSDVVVGITVNKVISVGGSAAAPASPLYGSWAYICPGSACGSTYSVIFTFNSDHTYTGTETVMDGSFTSTETGTWSGSYTGPGSTIVLVAKNCRSVGSTTVTGCDNIGVANPVGVTIFGSGAGSVATLGISNQTATVYKITP